MVTKHSREIGACYEKQALDYLVAQGLSFVAANVQCGHDEIDLIMTEQNTYVFVEVRYRKDARFGDAASTVTVKKQQKLQRAALTWLLHHHLDPEMVAFRFDVVAITGAVFCWIPDAFSA